MSILPQPSLQAAAPVFRWINYIDVIDCEDLQTRVMDSLSEEERRLFFYARPNSFRDGAITDGDAIAGCFAGEELIGQAILLRNSTGEKFNHNYMLERPVPAILQDRSSAVITNAMVDPASQGHGIMQSVLNFVSRNQRLFGIEAVFFITHVENHSMIMAGLRAGYRMVDAGICRNNNEPMYMMVRQPLLTALPVNRTVQIDLTNVDYRDVQNYLAGGWIGNALVGNQLVLQAA